VGSSLASGGAAGGGALLYRLGGSDTVLAVASLVFAVTAALAASTSYPRVVQALRMSDMTVRFVALVRAAHPPIDGDRVRGWDE
jgi:hypothetical protein